ncbi:sugar phosphate isomerase/epimerase family protein [candidate division KSB1 bacterium]
MKRHKLTFILMIVIIISILMVPTQITAGDLPPELYIGGFLIGPQAWSFKLYGFYGAVEKTKEVGCNVMGASGSQTLTADDKTRFDYKSPPSVWAKAKMKLEKTGVRILSYGNVYFKNDEADCRKAFDFAKIMGIPIILSEPDEKAYDIIEKLVKEYNIKIAIHNHAKNPEKPDYKYWDPNYVLECIKGRDPRIGACADIGHWMRSGVEPLKALKILEGRIHSCHLKDLNKFGVIDAHDVPYGEGKADVGAILKELKRQGFSGNIAIEYEYKWENNIPEIKKCVDFVREWGKDN